MKIETLFIPESCNNYTFDGRDIIKNLSKVNIFIGSNNSGKSRMLRGIYGEEIIKYNAETEILKSYNEFITDMAKEMERIFDSKKDYGFDELNKDYYIYKLEYLTRNGNELKSLLEELKKLEKVKPAGYAYIMDSDKQEADYICQKLKGLGEKRKQEFYDKGFEKMITTKNYRKIYIPVLRSLRKISVESKEDLLNKCTEKDYFKNVKVKDSDVEIFTGQTLYDDVLDLLLGDYKHRNNLSTFEKFLSDSFFNGEAVTLIPMKDSDVLYVKIGDEKEQPIYNLGDGIQSIIILTFKLFIHRGEDVLFFIEEPELYMHPGLQRKLIETFSDEQFDTYQYFLTSHSNHILDLTLDMNDISVFKFTKEVEEGEDEEKEAKFNIDNVNNDDMSVLSVLGVNNSSVFLSNSTIWVEGITDRFYLRKYLEIYQKEMLKKGEIDKLYIEDVHYSFLEYSGGNITHWDFLDDTEGDEAAMKHNKICTRMFLIADSDGYNEKGKDGYTKKERLEKLSNYFGEEFYCLKVKEIENMLVPKVIKKTVKHFKHKKGFQIDGVSRNREEDKDYELLSECELCMEDYKQANLGEFINKKIDEKIKENTKENVMRSRNYAKGNTIADKVKFCKYAIQEIKSLGDMSEEAKELCEKIYNFIKHNN